MTSISQLPSDYQKYLDQTLYHYPRKEALASTLYSKLPGDSADTTYEYVQLQQSYAAATGWTGFEAPETLADGVNPETKSMGTVDATATVSTHAEAYRILRKLETSSKPIVRSLLQQHAVEAVERIKVATNNTLVANMLSNASQSYSASNTWSSSSGDPFGDLVTAKASFKDASGGVDADFLILHTNEWADLQQDERWVSRDYTDSRPADTGTITARPLGLDVLVDTACTTGSFVLGKKGMFGQMFVTEDYVTKSETNLAVGTEYAVVYSYIDAYPLSYMLMAGSGI